VVVKEQPVIGSKSKMVNGDVFVSISLYRSWVTCVKDYVSTICTRAATVYFMNVEATWQPVLKAAFGYDWGKLYTGWSR